MIIELHWWYIPLAIAVLGTLLGVRVANTPESGIFPMNPFFGVMIIVVSLVIAVTFCLGHFV